MCIGKGRRDDKICESSENKEGCLGVLARIFGYEGRIGYGVSDSGEFSDISAPAHIFNRNHNKQLWHHLREFNSTDIGALPGQLSDKV